MGLAAVQHLNTAMLMRRVLAYGIRSTKDPMHMGREQRLLEVLPPLDWDKVGTETWGDVFNRVKEIGLLKVTSKLLSRSREDRGRMWENIFRPIRQPDWWQGDDQYHPPINQEPTSELERQLKAGKFVVTAEVAPPLSIKTDKLIKNIEMLKPFVTAINFTDSPSATPRMSSWACSKIAFESESRTSYADRSP